METGKTFDGRPFWEDKNKNYRDQINEILRNNGLPTWVNVFLSTNTSMIEWSSSIDIDQEVTSINHSNDYNNQFNEVIGWFTSSSIWFTWNNGSEFPF